MKYFIDDKNNIFAFEDDVRQIKPELKEITKTQFKSLKLFGVLDKTEDEVKEAEIEKQKTSLINKLKSEINRQRDTLTNQIVITINDKEIQADEKSQIRLNRALSLLTEDMTTNWINVNNQIVTLNSDEIKQILLEAGQKQTEYFVTANKLKGGLINLDLETLQLTYVEDFTLKQKEKEEIKQ